jgi:hypothetical protein
MVCVSPAVCLVSVYIASCPLCVELCVPNHHRILLTPRFTDVWWPSNPCLQSLAYTFSRREWPLSVGWTPRAPFVSMSIRQWPRRPAVMGTPSIKCTVQCTPVQTLPTDARVACLITKPSCCVSLCLLRSGNDGPSQRFTWFGPCARLAPGRIAHAYLGHVSVGVLVVLKTRKRAPARRLALQILRSFSPAKYVIDCRRFLIMKDGMVAFVRNGTARSCPAPEWSGADEWGLAGKRVWLPGAKELAGACRSSQLLLGVP